MHYFSRLFIFFSFIFTSLHATHDVRERLNGLEVMQLAAIDEAYDVCRRLELDPAHITTAMLMSSILEGSRGLGQISRTIECCARPSSYPSLANWAKRGAGLLRMRSKHPLLHTNPHWKCKQTAEGKEHVEKVLDSVCLVTVKKPGCYKRCIEEQGYCAHLNHDPNELKSELRAWFRGERAPYYGWRFIVEKEHEQEKDPSVRTPEKKEDNLDRLQETAQELLTRAQKNLLLAQLVLTDMVKKGSFIEEEDEVEAYGTDSKLSGLKGLKPWKVGKLTLNRKEKLSRSELKAIDKHLGHVRKIKQELLTVCLAKEEKVKWARQDLSDTLSRASSDAFEVSESEKVSEQTKILLVRFGALMNDPNLCHQENTEGRTNLGNIQVLLHVAQTVLAQPSIIQALRSVDFEKLEAELLDNPEIGRDIHTIINDLREIPGLNWLIAGDNRRVISGLAGWVRSAAVLNYILPMLVSSGRFIIDFFPAKFLMKQEKDLPGDMPAYLQLVAQKHAEAMVEKEGERDNLSSMVDSEEYPVGMDTIVRLYWLKAELKNLESEDDKKTDEIMEIRKKISEIGVSDEEYEQWRDYWIEYCAQDTEKDLRKKVLTTRVSRRVGDLIPIAIGKKEELSRRSATKAQKVAAEREQDEAYLLNGIYDAFKREGNLSDENVTYLLKSFGSEGDNLMVLQEYVKKHQQEFIQICVTRYISEKRHNFDDGSSDVRYLFYQWVKARVNKDYEEFAPHLEICRKEFERLRNEQEYYRKKVQDEDERIEKEKERIEEKGWTRFTHGVRSLKDIWGYLKIYFYERWKNSYEKQGASAGDLYKMAEVELKEYEKNLVIKCYALLNVLPGFRQYYPSSEKLKKLAIQVNPIFAYCIKPEERPNVIGFSEDFSAPFVTKLEVTLPTFDDPLVLDFNVDGNVDVETVECQGANAECGLHAMRNGFVIAANVKYDQHLKLDSKTLLDEIRQKVKETRGEEDTNWLDFYEVNEIARMLAIQLGISVTVIPSIELYDQGKNGLNDEVVNNLVSLQESLQGDQDFVHVIIRGNMNNAYGATQGHWVADVIYRKNGQLCFKHADSLGSCNKKRIGEFYQMLFNRKFSRIDDTKVMVGEGEAQRQESKSAIIERALAQMNLMKDILEYKAYALKGAVRLRTKKNDPPVIDKNTHEILQGFFKALRELEEQTNGQPVWTSYGYVDTPKFIRYILKVLRANIGREIKRYSRLGDDNNQKVIFFLNEEQKNLLSELEVQFGRATS